ncbi:Sybindin-like protein, partial [Piptocephalis cylindrospora]
MIYSIYLINKAGGLIFQRDFNDGLNKLTSNDYLILSGTFHGVHAIAAKLSPLNTSSGIEALETDTFRLYCSQTLTGVKILLLCEPTHQGASDQMRRVYELYADFVMKNPFYTPEMPIRCEKFD